MSDPTTEKAFQLLLDSDYYWSKTGETALSRASFRFRANQGKKLSLEKKQELLRQAGFTVKQEMTWNLPE